MRGRCGDAEGKVSVLEEEGKAKDGEVDRLEKALAEARELQRQLEEGGDVAHARIEELVPR